jgi:hypothetical protein
MRTARTYTLPADVIAMLDDLAREIADGNRSRKATVQPKRQGWALSGLL